MVKDRPTATTAKLQWMPVHPKNFGQRYNIRFVFKPVFPSLVQKPIFE
jgi:hypothetical protein